VLWELDAVAVEGPHTPLLRPTSVTLEGGQVRLVAGLPGEGHTALALVASGRMRPSSGRVRLDGSADAAGLRRAFAIVDAPGVSEPDGALPLATVVGEELAMAGRPAGRRAVADRLTAAGAASRARDRYEDVPAPLRLDLLAHLAADRPGVRGLVITAPDRHGHDPRAWWELAGELTASGLAVLVTCSESSAAALGVQPALIGFEGAPR
jgi:energy-coupling factor transporter ATP-binding protein EcfA2